ncbi:MAG: hypothetical protein MZV64_70900 [Ignavibacteriales bacterium]|nr:hypothetical protein [Ignavibacteriales bacterium]
MTTHYLNRVVLLNVYDMLFALGEDMGPQPSLVDKYTVSPDGLVYTADAAPRREVPQRQDRWMPRTSCTPSPRCRAKGRGPASSSGSSSPSRPPIRSTVKIALASR